MIRSDRDLKVWQTSMELASEVYRLRSRFPGDERFGLIAQLRRAAVSVASNIAEVQGRTHRGDYLHHLSIARGSTIEIEVQLLIGENLSYVAAADLERARDHCDAICRMITRLKQSLTRGKRERPPHQ